MWKEPRVERWAKSEKGRATRLKLSRDFREKHRERRNAYMRDWHAINADRRKNYRLKSKLRNPVVHMLYAAKDRATKRGLEFDLKIEDVSAPPLFCPVLGIELVYGSTKRLGASPSLERVDNTKGYVKGNVIIVSWRANNIKSNATLAELQAIVKFYEGL